MQNNYDTYPTFIECEQINFLRTRKTDLFWPLIAKVLGQTIQKQSQSSFSDKEPCANILKLLSGNKDVFDADTDIAIT